MSFMAKSANYQRHFRESAAWRLLRADNAPFILAFIATAFETDNEISYGQARILLDNALDEARLDGSWQTESNAMTYLNDWIKKGWLREMDNRLTVTDATDRVLRFCQSFDERIISTSASHLRIVQESVRDLAVMMSENTAERIAILEKQKAQLESQINDLNVGKMVYLNDYEKKERIREIYNLAYSLTGDFRLLEEEIRKMDKTLRVQMIDDNLSKGELLQKVFEQEDLLAKTDAGSAFDGFFHLLSDDNRLTEFTEQMRSVLKTTDKNQLAPHHHQFLSTIISELTRESDRVFRIRRRTEEQLKSYIESGTMSENHAVDRLISQLEKRAIAFKDTPKIIDKDLNLTIKVGKMPYSSPDSIRLRIAEEKLDLSDIQEHENNHTLSQKTLENLETVQVVEVAKKIYYTLDQYGAMSIASINNYMPIQAGLEELVAFIRIAKAVKATDIGQTELILVNDKFGNQLKATIPKLILTTEHFPQDFIDNPMALAL